MGLGIWHVAESKDRVRAGKEIFRVGVLGGTLGLALSAVQLLPTMELIPRSIRGAGYSFKDAATWSMHPADLINMVVPKLFGTPYTLNNADYWGDSFHAAGEPYLVSFFFGSSAAVAVLFSFFSRRRRLRAVLVILMLISVGLALGRFNPLYVWFCDHTSLARFGRFPSKYFLLGAACLAVLCSLGLEVILDSATSRSRERPRPGSRRAPGRPRPHAPERCGIRGRCRGSG